MSIKLTSPAFEDGGAIPSKYTGDGQDLSPELAWSGVPEGTESLVLMLDDPDVSRGAWVHWLLYDVPANASGLPEGVPKIDKLENGAAQGLCWGVDRFTRIGYHGPSLPPGATHRYVFKLYALAAPLGLPPRATKQEVIKAMKWHVLAEGELTGTYRP